MISTRGRYALRVMLDLAQHEQDGFISLKTVADRQGISMKYLEAIVAGLRHASLVESSRGKEGGYRLSRAPADYTAGEILRSLSSASSIFRSVSLRGFCVTPPNTFCSVPSGMPAFSAISL